MLVIHYVPFALPTLCESLRRRVLSVLKSGAVALLFLVSGIAFAQVDALQPQGFDPSSTYQHGDIDSISMINGTPVFHIPLYSLPQRGRLALSFSLIGATNTFRATKTCTANNFACYQVLSGFASGLKLVTDQSLTAGPQQFRFPINSNTFYNVYSVVDATGATHPLGYDNSNPALLRATDGSGFLYDAGTSTPYSPFIPAGNVTTIYEPNGIKHINNLTTFSGTIQDPDGNSIAFQSSIAPGAQITDSVGRVFPQGPPNPTASTSGCPAVSANYQPTISSTSWVVPGPNGAQVTYLFCYSSVTYRTNFFTNPPLCSPGQCQETSGTSTVLQSVVLPNGTYWSFIYDAANPNDSTSIGYAQIQQVKLPSGGTISYEYNNFYQTCNTTTPSIGRSVSQRTFDPGNGGTVGRWNYSFPQVLGAAIFNAALTYVNTATDPLGNDTVYTFSSQGGCDVHETQRKVYQGSQTSGTLLKTTTTAYQAALNPQQGVWSNSLPGTVVAVFPTTVTTALDNGVSTTTTYQYDDGGFSDVQPQCIAGPNNSFSCTFSAPQHIAYGRVTSTTATDFGGSTLSTVNTQYQYLQNPAYFASNFMDAIASITTLNGSAIQVAKVSYGYDEDNGSPQGTFGHQTSVNHWLNTTGVNVTSKTVFNTQGMVAQSIDPRSNITRYTYDTAGLFTVQIQRPDTITDGSTVHHIVNFTHDSTTGKPLTYSDENGNQTSYFYDNLARLTSVNYPDTGQTRYCYTDSGGPDCTQSAFPFQVIANNKITSSQTEKTTAVVDGFGRLTQTQVNSDPEGIDYTDTTYDALGRVATVSNPYRSTSDPTYGVTQTQYDALGRVKQVTKQDRSISTISYTANCTTATDEAGKRHRTCYDAVGRLIEVDEPGGAGASGAQATASVNISGAFGSTWTGGGTPHLAASGTAIASVTMTDGSSHNFYFDTNQHLMQLWDIGSSWNDQDLTAITAGPMPMAGSAISAVFQAPAIHVFYQGANQHIYDMNWTGSAWQNLDLTVLTGATGASGTRISALVGGPNSPMAFYQGPNQHFYIVYWAASINAWSNADLSGVPGVTTLVATNSGISSGAYGPGLYGFYIATNQHVITIYWSGTIWTTADLTAVSGGALAASGSSLTTTVPNAGATPLMTFYEGSNQHIYSSHWFTGNNSWQTADFTGATNLGALQTSLANNSGGPHAYYFTADQHLHDMNWNGSAWVNLDLTTLAGTSVVAASGSSLSSHGTFGGNPYHIFFEGADQHIYHTYKTSASAWINEDPLIVAGHNVTDTGTVSLSIPNGTSNFVATVCYGVSTNPFCTGKPVNASPADIANALAAILNGAGSPVNATVTGATLNLTWRTAGWVTATVASITSTPDNPSLFSSGSFASTAATFAGGVDPGSQSLTSPLVTLYQYDTLGNLTCVEQHGDSPADSHADGTAGTGCSASPSSDSNSTWRVRRFTYDSLSRLTSSSNPEANTATVGASLVRVNTAYAYDPNGNLLQKTSPAPNQSGTATQTISYCYDPLNRVTGKAYSAQTCTNGLLPAGTAVASYFYDQSSFNSLTIINGIGRRTGMTDPAGSEAWSYDSMGRPKADRRTITGSPNVTNTTSYLYDLIGSATSITYPSGRTISYGYNNAVRAVSAADTPNAITYATGATYSPVGALTSLTNGTNLTSRFHYNNRLQPCRVFVTTGAAIPANCVDPGAVGNILDFTYNFNSGVADNGNVTSIGNNRDGGRSQSFAYDSINRIASAQTSATTGTNCFGEGFVYDPWGNLLNIGGLVNYTGCTQENLGVGANVKNQVSTNAYDAAGNMTTGGYTYDAENHLLTAGGVTYTYDGDGKRVKKSSGKLYWYGMNADALDETDLTGATNNAAFNEYVFFGGKRIARRNSSNTVFYYFADHLGTSRVMVQGGQATACYDADFYPFGGERTPVTNTCPQNYKFTGKERDTESGLDDFGARFYASTIGRLTTPDEFFKDSHVGDPQSWNKYAYVRNNPLRYVDPNGEKATVSRNCTTTNNQTTCDVNISASIVIYSASGANLTQEQLTTAASQIQSSIQGSWTGSFTQDGVTYNITTQVTVSVATSEDAAMSSGAQNVIGMTDGAPVKGSGAITNPQTALGVLTGAPDTGMMDINHADNYAKHEFAHMLGIDDKEGAVVSNKLPWMRPDKATSQDYGWGIWEVTRAVQTWIHTPEVEYRNMRYGEMFEIHKPPTSTGQITVGAPVLWWK